MDEDQKKALRERNWTRAHCCPRCHSPNNHVLTDQEKRWRDDVFAELAYKTCDACGHTWRVEGGRA